jgi:anti-sigma-K factor RskA
MPLTRIVRRRPHVLAGAYAVHAIDDDAERARFERHLRRCQECSDELRRMSAIATRLGFAAAAPPPPRLREHVLAAASRTRQLPPPVGHDASPGEPRPGSARRLAWAIAGASFAVIIVLSTALLRTQNELDKATAREAAVVAVLSAPDARAMSRATSAGGTATVVYSLARHALIVTSANLPPPPAGKVYELWLLGPPHVRAAGLLPAVVHNHTAPVLVPHLAAGDQLGVTVEPAGGTSRPTTTPILVLPLPA